MIEGRKGACWGGRRALVRNSHKVSVFRVFLLQTYGIDFLNAADCTVLDVAGGKGDLAWELVNCCGIHAVVVDPRPISCGAKDKKWRQGMYEPNRVGPVFSKWFPAVHAGDRYRSPKHPDHLRIFFDAESTFKFVDGTVKNREQWLSAEQQRARAVKWTTKGLEHHEAEDYTEAEGEQDSQDVEIAVPYKHVEGGPEDVETVAPSEVIAADTALHLLHNCKLVVGLHPDQATGEIAAFASKLGIPWAVVPCCVYKNTFPKRRLRDGSSVTSHAGLIAWLCEMYPAAKVTSLDFEGKNQVVYIPP